MVAISLLLNEYARFGKPVHITEMGVPSGPARGERDNVDTADPQSQIGLTKVFGMRLGMSMFKPIGWNNSIL